MILPILHQDEDIIVVDKPAGMPTHAADPADPYPADALRVLQAQTGLSYLGMHQRLDADTSGVLLFSARPEANRALAAAFEGRAVRKVYLALVMGRPRQPEGVIDAPIARDRDGRYRATSARDPRGRAARTRYRILAARSETGRSTGATLLEVIPETGRSHQIRVHLAHIGCPVVGDPLYDAAAQGLSFPRLCLHAWQLALPHPATGEPITFIAPPPRPFAGLLPEPSHVRPAAQAASLAPALALALERRAALAADAGTTIYRLINAAGDGMPGLALDRYGDVLVVSVYDEPDNRGQESHPAKRAAHPERSPRQAADAVEGRRTGARPSTGGSPLSTSSRPPAQDALPAWRAIVSAVAENTGITSVYVKYRPRQASQLSDAELARRAPAEPVYGAPRPEVIAHEDGLAYVIRPGDGLSVGLFPDMREGRGRVRAWARGARVLNTFAYTCGFGVAALAGGAARVLNIDLSRGALAWGQENYRANGFAADPYDFVYGDVFDWLGRLARRGEQFELMILDPPGFARTRTRRFVAAQDYAELAALAARITARGGLLYACCNVAELPRRAFREQVLAGLADAGRRGEIVGVYHEPALDFPAAAGEEPYLKMLAVRLD
ncbi:MAG: tRNA pseudouridine synthase C [Chloroflexi bacterium ADurb.Bin325]|nr:MAG: tRNA pseudouridine synthase C [Chloroflexi bacterium ADurb.Bin325]